ncbi:MAG: arsenate reductase family protein [Clostridiales bacterium]|nr:arsenate reductase family protein [Clostridiales bacterium]
MAEKQLPFVLIGYRKCSTCRAVEKLLQSKGIDYRYRPIDTETPTAAELKQWQGQSGLAIKKFFNTSGQIYRERKLKDVLPTLTDEAAFALLASEGMLIKRPILLAGASVYVGRQVRDYLEGL